MDGGQQELVGEANHRIANHLMALGAIVQRRASRLCPGLKLVPREEVESAFAAIQNAIIAMERLHRAMAVNPAERELALAELFTAVLSDFKAIFQDRLTFNVGIPSDLRLDARLTSMLMQAFAEVVANAMKYAHPTGLPVELTVLGKVTREGGIDLMVSDDGVGLPEGFSDTGQAGMGLRLIRGLIESIDGRIKINSTELGLTFSISLPAAPRRQRHLQIVKNGDGCSLRSADYWRDKAEETRTIAEDLKDVSARNAMEDLARMYDVKASAPRK